MISEAEIQKIMSGSDFFACPMGARMRKEVCVKRQTAGISKDGRLYVPEECKDCKTGKGIREEEMEHSNLNRQPNLPASLGQAGKPGMALKEIKKMVETKKCKVCGEEKELGKFYKNPAGKDGHKNMCKDCKLKKQRGYRKRNKEKAKIKEQSGAGSPQRASIKEPKKKENGHPVFYRLLREMARIHSIKNADYGGGSPLGNFMEARKIGIEPWQGALVRMTDKYARVMSLACGREPAVKEENIRDTLIDLANYALLTIVLMEEEGIDRKEVS